MFTGIITDVGAVAEISEQGDWRIRLLTSYDTGTIDLGASIDCDGVCLTVVNRGRDQSSNWFDVDVSAETLSKTTIGSWKAGRRINLERALKVGDELGGHIVLGHVDGLAEILSIKDEQDSTVVIFRTGPELARFIATKGSVALNGTSLTVNEVTKDTFSVNLIPHTKSVTNWTDIKAGQKINLEIDPLARYVERLQSFEG